ncbi:MAG: DNA cytosine methyltransferase [Bacteroidetes bacterium]|nr:DNA cytosine methyltransferase [Bacteroidota bacterium]
MRNDLRHIELFAGCGGMSLGLDAAGFDLFFANELSPMAGETFAFNLFGENLSQLAEQKKRPENVVWIKSTFSQENLKDRLRENPFDFSKGMYSDIDSKTHLENKLIIGNIDDFLNLLARNKAICTNLRKQNIDLLSGGPPCQGFSLAGKRIKDDYKNILPLSFARFAGLIQPKVVLLENVKGITSPFETEDGVNHYAWLEVAKAFSLKGFVPVCMLLNSKYFGVPQNRPRFILYAFRKDVFEKLKARKNNSDLINSILLNSLLFYNKVNSKRMRLDEIKLTDIPLYDIESDPIFFDGKLLPKIKTNETEFLNAAAAIEDITSTNRKYKLAKIRNEYAFELSRLFKPKFGSSFEDLQNHEQRRHTYKVKARFRLLQALNNLNGIKQDAMQVISGKCEDEEVYQKVFKALKDEALLISSDGADIFERPKSLSSFKEYLKKIESKKHSQRAIKTNEPAPAQMTIPDDLCHYARTELRTLTVREMARLQSFPDWFVLRSKVTTGGKQRSFEVPQYTQIGNAVPPLLAYELGKTIGRLLKSIQ